MSKQVNIPTHRRDKYLVIILYKILVIILYKILVIILDKILVIILYKILLIILYIILVMILCKQVNRSVVNNTVYYTGNDIVQQVNRSIQYW